MGETGNTLRDRNNKHRSEIYRQKSEDALAKHLNEAHAHHIQNWNDEHFVLTPIEQVEDLGQRHLNKVRRLLREEHWIKLLHTFEPNGLNIKKYNYKTPLSTERDILPFITPYSKTSSKAAEIIKKHVEILQGKDILTNSDFKVITAYSRHQNLSQVLVSSRIRTNHTSQTSN